jgi:two-component system sensor histidine kinase UhpB
VSLRVQINLIIGTLMLLFVGTVVYLEIGDTRRGVRDEVEGSNLVATHLLTRMSWTYEKGGVRAMVAFLNGVGHVRANEVSLYDPAGQLVYNSPPPTYKAGRDAPAWFTELVAPTLTPQEIPIAGGKLTIRADPSRAILDGWEELVNLVEVVLVVCAVLFSSVFLLTRRALKPMRQIVASLERMEQGAYDTRLPPLPGAEARLMSVAFNRMAQAVEETTAAKRAASEAQLNLQQNRELTQMIQSHIEAERRDIARELHDELGQSITAVKSLGLSIIQRSEACDEGVTRAARLIVETAARMYDAVHQMIPRLRPFSLDDFGVADALQDLISEAQQQHPAVDLVLDISRLPAQLGDTLATSAYRIVQESLNNALRHADASRIAITVGTDADDLLVHVEDNGCGLPADWQRPGHFGLRGMRERATVLGGRFDVGAGKDGGVCVLARLPLN